MAIAQSIVDAVTEQSDGRRIERVRLVVGALSGVVADAVSFCFELCVMGTSIDGAVLEVIASAGRAKCRTCGDDIDLPDFIALCPCGSADLDIVAGQELVIQSVEVRV